MFFSQFLEIEKRSLRTVVYLFEKQIINYPNKIIKDIKILIPVFNTQFIKVFKSASQSIKNLQKIIKS